MSRQVLATNPPRPLRERIFTVQNDNARIGDKFRGAGGLGDMVPLLAGHGRQSTLKVTVTTIRAMRLKDPDQREIVHVDRAQTDAYAADFAIERLLDGGRDDGA